jgi:D-ribose pyranase
MLKSGILNPAINSLLSRVRHTNTLVISDRCFPFYGDLEIVDLSLVDDVPRISDVLRAVRMNFDVGRAYMAQEFRTENPTEICRALDCELEGVPVQFEPHIDFKKRVPYATGIIRTGDTTRYGNMVLESV